MKTPNETGAMVMPTLSAKPPGQSAGCSLPPQGRGRPGLGAGMSLRDQMEQAWGAPLASGSVFDSICTAVDRHDEELKAVTDVLEQTSGVLLAGAKQTKALTIEVDRLVATEDETNTDLAFIAEVLGDTRDQVEVLSHGALLGARRANTLEQFLGGAEDKVDALDEKCGDATDALHERVVRLERDRDALARQHRDDSREIAALVTRVNYLTNVRSTMREVLDGLDEIRTGFRVEIDGLREELARVQSKVPV